MLYFYTFFQFVAVLSVVVATNYAQTIHIPTIVKSPALIKTVELDSPPNYDFAYSVNDPTTGDIKNQQESRKGDVVQGSYSLVDADGLLRTVHYSADDLNGFNAIVQRTPTNIKIPIATKLTKVLTAGPLAHSVSTVSHGPLLGGLTKVVSSVPVIGKIVAGPALSQVSFAAPAISYHY